MHICHVDLTQRRDVRRYIEFPFRLYRDCSLWVPPLVSEIRDQMDPNRHPFYQHSTAAFFLALEGDEVVGRIAVLDNARYNQYHKDKEHTGFFYHFDVVDDQRVSSALFDAAFDWARSRGVSLLWGPKGFIAIDGQGVLVEGFEHRPALGIPYNYDYYDGLLKDAGFERQLDFVSAYIDRQIDLPKRFLKVAEKVKRRRGLRSVSFRTKAELRALIPRVTSVYNKSFVEVQGYVPITEAEAEMVGNRILAVADPSLIKVLMREDELVGFVLAYPDISAAVQRCRGRMWPWGWYHMLREFKRTRWLNINGMAILERYRGLGGNALLYAELYHTLMTGTQFQCADLVQVQETNARMIGELEAVGVRPYKTHRVYRRALT
jgi:GNAT superfamily N-acetyltransferase